MSVKSQTGERLSVPGGPEEEELLLVLYRSAQSKAEISVHC
jgi:hypothetical protein